VLIGVGYACAHKGECTCVFVSVYVVLCSKNMDGVCRDGATCGSCTWMRDIVNNGGLGKFYEHYSYSWRFIG
jgi:hypothetical protein